MKLGIIGTGNMAAQMLQAADHVDGLDVAAILSRSTDRAARFSSTYAPGAQGFDALAPFLAAVDAIYIATPPDQHLSAIDAALEAGKPVLCEKPFTNTPQATKAAIAKAQATGTPMMEALWTLTLPAYQALKKQIADIDPGTCRMRFDFSYPLNAAADAHFFDADRGGVLLDRAVYGYGAALHLFGEIAQQEVRLDRDAAGLDRAATLHLTHENGAQSLITLSFDHLGANLLDVATPHGSAVLGPNALMAETLSWTPFNAPAPAGGPHGKPGLVSRLKSKPALRKLKASANAMKGQFHGFGASPYQSVLAEFAQMVRDGQSQSAIVPLSLSARIADLTADARATQ